MKRLVTLSIILLFVFGMAVSLAYAVDYDERDRAWEVTHGVPGLDIARDRTYDVGAYDHADGSATDPTQALAFVPEFPMVALPGIVGFAGLALAWLKRFFYR
jgi:hypothetical protein